MKKRYILIICLIICLCSIQTVMAGEIDANCTKQDSIQMDDVNHINEDNHALSSTQDNNILNTTEDSFTQLNNML